MNSQSCLNYLLIKKSFLVLASLILVACGSTKIKPFNESSKLSNLTKAEKRYWYESEQTLIRIKNSGLLIEDEALSRYLNSIAKRLYPVYSEYVNVRVVNAPSYNAFVMPNGDVYIHSAMLATLQNEAQLAMIISHELAHFVKKHGAINANKFENGMAAGAVLNTVIPLVGLLGQGIAVTSMYGLSRESEHEADTLGFKNYVNAGYPPHEAVKAFYVLQEESELSQDNEAFMFASHPKLQDRIDSISLLVEELKLPPQEYEEDSYYIQITEELSNALPAKLYENGRFLQLLKLLNNKRRKVENEPFFRAMALLKIEEKTFDDVEVLFQKQINSFPDYADPYREYGYLLASNNRKGDAIKMFDKYLQLNPNSINKWFVLDKLQQIKSTEQK